MLSSASSFIGMRYHRECFMLLIAVRSHISRSDDIVGSFFMLFKPEVFPALRSFTTPDKDLWPTTQCVVSCCMSQTNWHGS